MMSLVLQFKAIKEELITENMFNFIGLKKWQGFLATELFHKYKGQSLGDTGAIVKLKLFKEPPNKID